MKLATWILTGLACLLIFAGSVQAAWLDWWQTPEQQAAKAFENADHEALLKNAPDVGWTGLGQYQAGDYEAAARSFAEQASQQLSNDDLEAANRMRYNQGVSEVRAGRYDAAIDQFDAVLEADPAFEDAAHNLGIAQQLKALVDQRNQQEEQQDAQQEGQQREQEDQQGEQEDQQGEPGDQQEGEQGEPQNADQEEGDQQGEPQSGNEPGDASSEASQSGQSESEEQKAAEEARKALEAEARQQSDADIEAQDEGSDAGFEAVERPLSEGEQATEQLLRRIPDDPAGLLRRKLEQSHRSKYPEVRDALEPW